MTSRPTPAIPCLDDLAAELRPQIEALPRLTRLVVRYLALLARDESPRALAEGLEADGVLSRWLLRQANSGYFNLPRPVVTLADALVVIGVEALTRMVFAVCTRDLLTVPPAPVPRWRQRVLEARVDLRRAGAGVRPPRRPVVRPGARGGAPRRACCTTSASGRWTPSSTAARGIAR